MTPSPTANNLPEFEYSVLFIKNRNAPYPACRRELTTRSEWFREICHAREVHRTHLHSQGFPYVELHDAEKVLKVLLDIIRYGK